MASTPNHAAQGGFIAYLTLKLVPIIQIAVPELYWGLIGLFAVMGALPDLIGFWGNWVRKDNWTLYYRTHRGDIAAKLDWMPPYALHLFVDIPFHKTGGNWFYQLWWLELLLWVVMGAIVWVMG